MQVVTYGLNDLSEWMWLVTFFLLPIYSLFDHASNEWTEFPHCHKRVVFVDHVLWRKEDEPHATRVCEKNWPSVHLYGSDMNYKPPLMFCRQRMSELDESIESHRGLCTFTQLSLVVFQSVMRVLNRQKHQLHDIIYSENNAENDEIPPSESMSTIWLRFFSGKQKTKDVFLFAKERAERMFSWMYWVLRVEPSEEKKRVSATAVLLAESKLLATKDIENLRPWSYNEKSSWSLLPCAARIKNDREESTRAFSREKTWLTHTHELEMIAGKLYWTSHL